MLFMKDSKQNCVIGYHFQLTSKMIKSYSTYHQQKNVITFILHSSKTIEIILYDEIEKYFQKCTIIPGKFKGLLGMIYEDTGELYNELIKEKSAINIINDGSDLYLHYRVQYFKGIYQGRQKLYSQKYLREKQSQHYLQAQVQNHHIYIPQALQSIQIINKSMNDVIKQLELANDKLIVSQLAFVNNHSTWLVNKSSKLILELPEKAYARQEVHAKDCKSLYCQMSFNQYHQIGIQPRYYLAFGFIQKSCIDLLRQNYSKQRTISLEIEFMKINTSFFNDLQVYSNNNNIVNLKNISISVVLNHLQNMIQVSYKLNKQQFNIIQKQLPSQEWLHFDELVPFIYLKESFLHFRMNWVQQ